MDGAEQSGVSGGVGKDLRAVLDRGESWVREDRGRI